MIHLNFLFLISKFISSWPVALHKSLLEIIFGHPVKSLHFVICIDFILCDFIFCVVVPGVGDVTDAQLVPRCVAALCEMAVVESFTTYIVPQILDFITGKFQADECRAGISSFR